MLGVWINLWTHVSPIATTPATIFVVMAEAIILFREGGLFEELYELNTVMVQINHFPHTNSYINNKFGELKWGGISKHLSMRVLKRGFYQKM